MKYIYETKKIKKLKDNEMKLHKIAKKFFYNINLLKNETLIALRASSNADNEIDIYGAYYGTESSPIDVYAQNQENRKKAFLAEALDYEAMIKFIDKESDENIYIFKVKFQEFHMVDITSFYGGKYDLQVIVFGSHEGDKPKGQVLKEFGNDIYTPSLNYY